MSLSLAELEKRLNVCGSYLLAWEQILALHNSNRGYASDRAKQIEALKGECSKYAQQMRQWLCEEAVK